MKALSIGAAIAAGCLFTACKIEAPLSDGYGTVTSTHRPPDASLLPDAGAPGDAGYADAGPGYVDAGTGYADAGAADAGAADAGAADAGATATAGPGFPVGAPWLSFYGTAKQMGDLARVASTFRVINVDADPGPNVSNFTAAQIAALKNGGQNKVISYLNLGSCESFRDYYAATGGVYTCMGSGANLGSYGGYPDENWMNPSNANYQHLMVEIVAPRLAAQGVDGFYLDNLEIVEHGTNTTNGPCDATCSQGGLDLVWLLRQKFPGLLIVMQNATSDVTRLGTTHGVPYPALLDAVSHEEVWYPKLDSQALDQLRAWRAMNIVVGVNPFLIMTEDYVGACPPNATATQVANAQTDYTNSRNEGFSPYVSNSSGGQLVVCYWPF